MPSFILLFLFCKKFFFSSCSSTLSKTLLATYLGLHTSPHRQLFCQSSRASGDAFTNLRISSRPSSAISFLGFFFFSPVLQRHIHRQTSPSHLLLPSLPLSRSPHTHSPPSLIIYPILWSSCLPVLDCMSYSLQSFS